MGRSLSTKVIRPDQLQKIADRFFGWGYQDWENPDCWVWPRSWNMECFVGGGWGRSS